MFRLQDNTPSVYTNQSRDFQLFCRVYDCINNGVKYDIDSMIHILNPMKANDRMLNLLCTRVGFFPKSQYDSNILRHIIESFPYALKHKGTKKGIEIAVSTILKAEKDTYIFRDTDLKTSIEVTVQIDNSNHVIAIYASSDILNLHALEDFLSYILPVGYIYTFGTYDPRSLDAIKIGTSDSFKALISPSVSNSQIRGSNRYFDPNSNNSYQFKTDLQDKFIGTYNTTEVVGTANYLSVVEGDKVSNEGTILYGSDISNTVRDKIDEANRTQEKGELDEN